MREMKYMYDFHEANVSIVSYITRLHPSWEAALYTEKKLIAK